MSIKRLIEAIGMPARELRGLLLDEIEEFGETRTVEDAEEEFGDILFALTAMAWAHSGRHFELGTTAFEPKVKTRLRRHGTLRRHKPVYHHDQVPALKFGVLHFAFGSFSGQWTEFDALKNGTVAEIHLLTDAAFGTREGRTNHCIVTFDDVGQLDFAIISGASEMRAGNVVLCRIPDFLFRHAKAENAFGELSEYLSLQVMAALDCLRFASEPVAHFHSWEGGFMADSEECVEFLKRFTKLFSPYLTTGRLRPLVDSIGGEGWTMTMAELNGASGYEAKLSRLCDRIVLESSLDHRFYSAFMPPGKLDLRSFAQEDAASFPTDPPHADRLEFISGGRPVREKGFVELCREFADVAKWAALRNMHVSLSILCRDRRTEKGSRYIEEISDAIERYGLAGIVRIEERISLDQLRNRIGAAAGVIVPSLFDPFCLMATYAVEMARPAFVSVNAGVSENIQSREFIFDPEVPGDLARVIAAWFNQQPRFSYQALYPTYQTLYLNGHG